MLPSPAGGCYVRGRPDSALKLVSGAHRALCADAWTLH